MQAELSRSISQLVERAYNVIIFDLAESSHVFKQYDCNLINELCEFVLNRKVNVSFNRLGSKPNCNSRSVSPRPVKIKVSDIATKREFMKNLFRLKNSPVEFHNVSVKHDITVDERAKEKELYEIVKENNEDSNPDCKKYFLVRGPLSNLEVVKV